MHNTNRNSLVMIGLSVSLLTALGFEVFKTPSAGKISKLSAGRYTAPSKPEDVEVSVLGDTILSFAHKGDGSNDDVPTKYVIYAKMRQVEALVVQGATLVQAVNQVGITEQKYNEWREQLKRRHQVGIS